MARTESTMLPLGTSAPDFALTEPATGRTVALADFAADRALLVMFICNHCPFVVHVRAGLSALGRDYEGRELGIVAISANDAAAYPDDAPDKLAAEANAHDYRFPYLHDETQEVAKAYTAACTPDFFLFDADRKLAYRGQLDGARPGNDVPVTGEDLRAAIDTLLAGGTVPTEQKPSIGCNIKWKAGNAPGYYG